MSSFQQIFSYGPPEEPDEFVPPAWFAPPQMELGESVPVALVVSRSERAVVALRQVIAYSTGVHLEFVALARGLSQREANNLFHDQHRMAGEEPPAELLRIGVELSDGEYRIWAALITTSGNRTGRPMARCSCRTEEAAARPAVDGSP